MTTILNANIDERVKNMEITTDEMKKIQTALKDEKFRTLFASYAEEISDPANRKLYEDEISQMESQRGMDVKFVNPTPGYVIKTTVEGTTKAFINICTNDAIAKPTSKREDKGMNWQIPYSFSPVREDVDKKGNHCKVFDFVIHPDTYRMAETNARFQKMIHDTCCEGIQTSFSMKVDVANLRKINMKFKGVPTATVIRTEKSGFDKTSINKPDSDDILSKFPYPYGAETSTSIADRSKSKNTPTSTKTQATPTYKKETTPTSTTPTYSLTHSSSFDIISTATPLKQSTRPSHLIVSVDLPLLKSSAQVELDILERSLKLNCDVPGARYNLSVQLPYPVDESEGTAKFDKKNHKLNISLPVVQQSVEEMPKISEESIIEVISSETTETKDSNTVTSVSTNGSDNSADNGYDSDDNCQFRLSKFPLESSKILPQLAKDHKITDMEEFIVYIAKVRRISKRSVNVATDLKGRFQISFQSLGDGCFPQEFLTCVETVPALPTSVNQTEADVGGKSTQIRVDVDATSIVVRMAKSCLGVSQNLKSYSIGVDFKSLQIVDLPSKSNVKSTLKEMRKSRMVNTSQTEDEATKFNVVRIDREKLVIDIGAKNISKEEDSSQSPDTPPLSGVPRLHSILRQRSITVSEPNESLFTSTTDGDETSSEMLQRRRRTVSFSEYIDSTSFRNNDTIAKMHNSLKNKRKNKRRKDQRKNSKDEKNKQSDCSDHENAKNNVKPHKKVKRGKRKPSKNSDSTSDSTKTDQSDAIEQVTAEVVEKVVVQDKNPVIKTDQKGVVQDKIIPTINTDPKIKTHKGDTDVKGQDKNPPKTKNDPKGPEKNAIQTKAKTADKVDTMLSWEDNSAPISSTIADNKFQFSNTAMFELDD